MARLSQVAPRATKTPTAGPALRLADVELQAVHVPLAPRALDVVGGGGPSYVPSPSSTFVTGAEPKGKPIVEREWAYPYRLEYGEVRRKERVAGELRELPQLPFDFATAYHLAMAPIARRLDAKKSEWGACRARSIRLDPEERLDTCGVRAVTIKCGCRHVRVPVPCGLRWRCEKCQKRIQARQRHRFTAALSMHWHDAELAWRGRGCQRGKRSTWRLVTLTVRHSGDIRKDRDAIVRGWKLLRQWLWQVIGKFPFALVWEFTEGLDGRGHLHAHVAALWPYVDYGELRAEWLRACPESSRINIESGANGSRDVASYLSKYASKGVDTCGMSPVLAAHVIAANYGQRLVTTSQKFYVARSPLCPTCGEFFLLDKLPEPLATLVPYAIWDARARQSGVGLCRGPPNTG